MLLSWGKSNNAAYNVNVWGYRTSVAGGEGVIIAMRVCVNGFEARANHYRTLASWVRMTITVGVLCCLYQFASSTRTHQNGTIARPPPPH